MNKTLFVNDLFNDLKDKIEFDEDVLALTKILITMFKINRSNSEKCWIYLMKKYDIKSLKDKTNFFPLINYYLKLYLLKTNIKALINLVALVPPKNKKVIDNFCFNIFKPNNIIYPYFKNIILKNKLIKEFNEIKYLIMNYNCHKLIFDPTTFLKNTILMHIKYNKINISFLLTISEVPTSKKDQAILKSLLIDYI